MDKHVTKQDDMMDAIVFHHYGYVDGALEAVFTANPALREHPVKLPMGLTIVLPSIGKPAATRLTRMWDK